MMKDSSVIESAADAEPAQDVETNGDEEENCRGDTSAPRWTEDMHSKLKSEAVERTTLSQKRIDYSLASSLTSQKDKNDKQGDVKAADAIEEDDEFHDTFNDNGLDINVSRMSFDLGDGIDASRVPGSLGRRSVNFHHTVERPTMPSFGGQHTPLSIITTRDHNPHRRVTTESEITYSEIKRRRMSLWKFENYELPQSTYTLLITESVLSRPFFAGIVAAGLSVMSLSIVLINEIENGTADNPLGLPAGVETEVRMAQYLGENLGGVDILNVSYVCAFNFFMYLCFVCVMCKNTKLNLQYMYISFRCDHRCSYGRGSTTGVGNHCQGYRAKQ